MKKFTIFAAELYININAVSFLMWYDMKKISILLLIFAGSLTCMARPIDVSKAKQTALQFIETRYQGSEKSKSRASSVPKLELAYTKSGEVGNVFYVFNQLHDQGFIIISADDRVKPILGYADRGTFDSGALPDGLKDIFKSYEKQISYAIKNNTAPSCALTRVSDEWADIEPLIQTQWNQNEPYNYMCPIDPDDGYRCAAGCVAVAKAQLLYYHQPPKIGTETISYEWKGKTLSADFSMANFEWDKMMLTYDYNTLDIDNAVAKLMWYCAVQSNAFFSSDGTYAYWNMDGLITHFGFKGGIKFLYRDYTTEEVFEEIIYQDIAKGLPVFYTAADSESDSHAFLVDGYQNGGYFHMNFGWGGYDDGFYLLSAINVEWYNFTTGHSIYYNIQPDIPDKWFVKTNDSRYFLMNNIGSIEADPENETDLMLLDLSGNIIASGFASVSFIKTEGDLPDGIIKGDANGDGSVNAEDLVEIVYYVLGKPSILFKSIAADINGDGIVNDDDIKGVVEIIMAKKN